MLAHHHRPVRLALILGFLAGSIAVSPTAGAKSHDSPVQATNAASPDGVEVHHDCDDDEILVYCNVTISKASDSTEIKIRGVMSGWFLDDLKMKYEVKRDGVLIWQSIMECDGSTSCDKTEWIPECVPGSLYSVNMEFYSPEKHPHHLRDSDFVKT